MQVFQDLFTQEQLQQLRQLPEVQAAYEKISTRTSVSFHIPLTDTLRQTLQKSFQLDLSTKTTIPCRWIKGDTPPHIDRGSSSFDTTYLVYLTDGQGTFCLGDEIYPIVAASGFSFPEGVSHEVTGTNGTTRLLLGPMSEQGFAVGGGSSTLDGNGETDTLFIRQKPDAPGYDWKRDSTNPDNVVDWTTLVGEPIGIQNTAADKGANILKVIFETNLTIESSLFYFTCNSDGIQFGSSSVETTGEKRGIVIDGVTGYVGFIGNGSSGADGYSDIYVYNLNVAVDNGSTLASGGGWVGQGYFGKNAERNFILNCSSSGPIPLNAGGIVGQYAAYRSTASNTSLSMIGCSSTGAIGTSAGGIVGLRAGNGTGASCIIEQSFSEGTIGQSAGGIVGQYAGNVTVRKSYSLGTIDNAGGGIFGRFGGDDSDAYGHSATAEKCYSKGTIGVGAGGIFGREAGLFTGSAIATNCYTTGSINTTGGIAGGGGIFGREYANQTVANCYVSGAISDGTSVGYILANSSTQPSTTYSEAKNGGTAWSDTNANSVLLEFPVGGAGATWASRGTNSPYELVNLGPTPYQRQTVSGSSLVQTYSQTVTSGSASVKALGADASGNAFTILKKTGGDSASHTTITMSAQTGSIFTTAATVPGTYTLTVRSIGSYFITTFVLTVIGANSSASERTGCCVSTMDERGLSYEWINDYKIGNRLILEVSQNPNTKFDGYSQYVKYKMAKGARKY